MAQHFHLLRHGQSTFNDAFDRDGTDPGEIDSRLTELGRQQAIEARGLIGGLRFDLVVTSPATRAIQTLLLLFPDPAHRPPVVVEPLVRDRFVRDSCDYGRHPADLAADFPSVDFANVPDQWWCSVPALGSEPEVESRDMFADRVAALRTWLTRRPEHSILVVGHHGTFQLLTGKPMRNCELVAWAPSEMPRPSAPVP